MDRQQVGPFDRQLSIGDQDSSREQSNDPELPAVAGSDLVGRKTQMEEVLGGVLRYGVVVSFIILAVGVAGLLFALHASRGRASLSSLIPSASDNVVIMRSLSDVLGHLLRRDPNGVVALGLIVLMITPILRVVVSALLFFLERDRLYVAITLFVLAVLAVSYLIGAA